MNESKENLEMSLLNYFILLLSTVAWIVIMFLPICEFIQAKVLSIIIRKYFQVKIKNIILKASKKGTAFLIISHDLHFISTFSSECLVIEDAKLTIKQISEYVKN